MGDDDGGHDYEPIFVVAIFKMIRLTTKKNPNRKMMEER
jgi:hypothetical protein